MLLKSVSFICCLGFAISAGGISSLRQEDGLTQQVASLDDAFLDKRDPITRRDDEPSSGIGADSISLRQDDSSDASRTENRDTDVLTSRQDSAERFLNARRNEASILPPDRGVFGTRISTRQDTPYTKGQSYQAVPLATFYRSDRRSTFGLRSSRRFSAQTGPTSTDSSNPPISRSFNVGSESADGNLEDPFRGLGPRLLQGRTNTEDSRISRSSSEEVTPSLTSDTSTARLGHDLSPLSQDKVSISIASRSTQESVTGSQNPLSRASIVLGQAGPSPLTQEIVSIPAIATKTTQELIAQRSPIEQTPIDLRRINPPPSPLSEVQVTSISSRANVDTLSPVKPTPIARNSIGLRAVRIVGPSTLAQEILPRINTEQLVTVKRGPIIRTSVGFGQIGSRLIPPPFTENIIPKTPIAFSPLLNRAQISKTQTGLVSGPLSPLNQEILPLTIASRTAQEPVSTAQLSPVSRTSVTSQSDPSSRRSLKLRVSEQTSQVNSRTSSVPVPTQPSPGATTAAVEIGSIVSGAVVGPQPETRVSGGISRTSKTLTRVAPVLERQSAIGPVVPTGGFLKRPTLGLGAGPATYPIPSITPLGLRTQVGSVPLGLAPGTYPVPGITSLGLGPQVGPVPLGLAPATYPVPGISPLAFQRPVGLVPLGLAPATYPVSGIAPLALGRQAGPVPLGLVPATYPVPGVAPLSFRRPVVPVPLGLAPATYPVPGINPLAIRRQVGTVPLGLAPATYPIPVVGTPTLAPRVVPPINLTPPPIAVAPPQPIVEPQLPSDQYETGYEFVTHDGGAVAKEERGNELGFKAGTYSLQSPEGFYRIVQYVADDGGFRALIRTNEPGTDNQNPAAVEVLSESLVAPPVAVAPAPLPLTPVLTPIATPLVPIAPVGILARRNQDSLRRDGVSSARTPIAPPQFGLRESPLRRRTQEPLRRTDGISSAPKPIAPTESTVQAGRTRSSTRRNDGLKTTKS